MIGPIADDLLRRIEGRKDLIKILTAFLVIAGSWVLGKAIAREDYGIPLLVIGAVVFYLLLFHKSSLLWLAPLAICAPNLGLDIPGPWAVSIEDAFAVIAFAAMLMRAIITKQPVIPRDSPILTPLYLFWAVAVVSLFKVSLISPDNMVTIIKDLLRLTMLVMFYMVMVDAVRTKANVLTVIRMLMIIAVPVALVSWYIYMTRSAFFYDLLTMKPAFIFYKTKILRMISIMGSTSYTGLYYAIILAVSMTYPAWRMARRYAPPRAAFAALMVSCLVFTFNRGTFVGVLFGLTILMFLGKMTWKKVVAAMSLSLVAVVMAGMQYFSKLDVEQKVNVVIEVSRSSGTARLVRWLSAVNVVEDQPILGVGYNNYAYVYGRYSIEQGVIPTYGSPHNMYVDILTGVGIIGFAVFTVILWRLWKMHLANLRDRRDPELYNVSLGLFLAFAFFLGASGFDSFFFKPHHTSYIIFLLWALTTSIWRMNREAASNP